MYSSISDMIEKRVANQTRGKISHIDNNQEGLVAFYNSLNRNERIKYRVYANNDAYHLDYRTLDASYFDSYDATVAYIEQLQTTECHHDYLSRADCCVLGLCSDCTWCF